MKINTVKPIGRRAQNKAETRQKISNVATELFVQHGFENVSIDEIARKAGVARKTVFNYFPRKEDLVFDREEESRALVRRALLDRGQRSPLDALHQLMRTLWETQHPLFKMSERPVRFWRAVAASPTLSTRARELQATLADDLAALLAESVDKPQADADARLAASMLMGTWVIAYGEALRAYRRKQKPAPVFERVMNRGFAGVKAALDKTPYAR